MKHEFQKNKKILAILCLIFSYTFIQNAKSQTIDTDGPGVYNSIIFTNITVDNLNISTPTKFDPNRKICAGTNKTIQISFKNVLKTDIDFSITPVTIRAYNLPDVQNTPASTIHTYPPITIKTGRMAAGQVKSLTITTQANFSYTGNTICVVDVSLLDPTHLYLYPFCYSSRTIAVSSPISSLTVSNPNPCIGSPVTLTATPTGTDYTYLFHPNFAGDYTTYHTSNQTTITPTTAGKKTWNVTVKDKNGCTSTAVAQNVEVFALPTATLTINAAPYPIINHVSCLGNQILLNANATSGKAPFTFDFHPKGYVGALDSIAVNDFYPTTTGYKTWYVIVTDANRCSTKLTVDSRTQITTSCNSLRIGEDVIKPSLTISPNPSEGQYNVSCEGTKVISIQVHSLLGDEVHHDESGNTSFDISDQPNGMYHVTVKTDTDIIKTKIIKLK